jgi:hypothetical protein
VLAALLAANSGLGPLGVDVLDYALPASLLNQLVGLELVTLVLVVPTTVAAALLVLRGSRRAPLLALGPTSYCAYMFVQYVVGPSRTSQSPSVLLHLAIAVLAGGLTAWCWRFVTDDDLHLPRPEHPVRRSAWLLFLAGFVTTRYLPTLAGALTAGPIPAEYVEAPAFYWVIVLLDVGVVVPVAVATAMAVWRGSQHAQQAYYALLGWFALVPPSVAAMAAVMVVKDDPHASLPTLALTTVASIAFALPALYAVGDLRSARP